MKNLKVTPLNVNELSKATPPNAIIITYSDHYRGNSGDWILLTDNKGKDKEGWLNRFHPHNSMDDRGVISAKAITSENGAMYAFITFKLLCEAYVKASNELKEWENGNCVYNIPDPDKSEYSKHGNLGVSYKDQTKFEETQWFKRYSSRSKEETIKKKKMLFLENQTKKNQYIQVLLEKNKENAKKWFESNEISVRNAYLFSEGYYR